MTTTNARLLLADGTTFEGTAIGAIGQTSGEIAFNTGMTGYQEIFTDPSYLGQILVMNTAHIGNYGVHSTETESDSIKISGLVVKKFSEVFSRVGETSSTQQYLEDNGVVGISDIDTRALVRHIRDAGAMNAIIDSTGASIDSLKKTLESVPSMEGLELSSRVSTDKVLSVGAEDAKHHVAMLDLGTKQNIVRSLTKRGCRLTIFPMQTPAKEILTAGADGIMLSNGPGDPSAMTEVISTVKELVTSGTPCFGICLGHQVIALSMGLPTRKMHHGHRGINHPVMNLLTGKAEITSQNHGFVMSEAEAEQSKDIEITHRHLNDDTIAGIRLKDYPVMSVQYHPEACPGPHDSDYLFDQFVEMIESHRSAISTK